MELKICDLSKTYTHKQRKFPFNPKNTLILKKEALRDVSFTLNEGLYGLLGPNGAGKSTMMKIMAGIMHADKGEVLWNGEDIHKLGIEYRRILGYMPQQQGLYPGFTGRRFLDYMCALKEIPKELCAEEILRVADIVNLLSELDKQMDAYSGGMKQRILLASALLGNPKFLILDEPTAGLDPKERVRLRKTLKALAKDKIIIIATHVVSDVEWEADEVLILKDGQLIAKGSVQEIKHQFSGSDGLEDVYLKIFGNDEKEKG